MNESFLWLSIYGLLTMVVVGGMVILPSLLGERHDRKPTRRGESGTNQPYESGIRPTGSARLRIPIQYYLLAMLFVLFDLEAVYLYAWALVGREAGWSGFVEVLIFLILLAVALLYVWRVGALDWHTRVGPDTQKRARQVGHQGRSKEGALVA